MKLKTTSLILTSVILGFTSTASGQDRNTSQGSNAGASVTSADDSMFFGFDAGRFLTSGLNNTFFGSQAGIGILETSSGDRLNNGATLITPFNASNNVLLGYRAGWQSNGSDNTFLGAEAGAHSTGSDNTFVGTEAGEKNTSGQDNTFIGEESGYQNTSGSDNTFVGEDAGAIITSGGNNTAIGAGAMAGGGANGTDPTAGASYSNTAIGFEAGHDIGSSQASYHNTLVGVRAGGDIGGGHVNTFVGAQAGYNTEWSDYCTFVGAGAGWNNNRNSNQSTSNRNSYFGMAAGMINRNGSDNVAIGAFADFDTWEGFPDSAITDAFEDENSNGFNMLPADSTNSNYNRTVILGSYATSREDDAIALGYSADSTGERAIALGSGAQATHPDSIAIGYQAASHGDNIAVIGNASTLSIDPGADGVTALGSASYRFSEANAKTIRAIADSSSSAEISLLADGGASDDDQWKLAAADGGDFTVSSFATGADRAILTASNTGDVTILGDVIVNSDRRLKEQVRDLANPGELVDQLSGKTYHWKSDLGRDDRTHYGFIAQEVEAVIPELVSTNEESGIKSVNYQGFAPILVNAVKELRAHNESQREEISLLKEQLKLQRKLLSELTKSLPQ